MSRNFLLETGTKSEFFGGFESSCSYLKKKWNLKNIPTLCLKDVSGICSPILANIWNEEILLNKHFSENLKLVDVSFIFKEKDKTFVENYRPVSALPTVSKIFEKRTPKQISD